MEPALPSMDQAPDRFNSGNGGQAPIREKKKITSDEVVLRNRLTALVVDDVPTCRIVEEAHLRSYGVETQSVDNGFDALELIASGARFNLIVIEMRLSTLNGIELTLLSLSNRCSTIIYVFHSKNSNSRHHLI